MTQFFRRRGYKVSAVTVTAAALGASAKAGPAGLAAAAAKAGLAAGGVGAATGFKLLLAKFMALTKAQTSVLCVVLVVAPVAWEWQASRRAHQGAAITQAKLNSVREQQSQADYDLRKLKAESARLDGAISNALQNQGRYEAAAAKLDQLKSRVQGLLSDPHYQWPEDLPYVLVPKSEVRALDLLHKPGTFGSDGALNEPALELLGITAAEKAPVEEALARYWRTVDEMTENDAYQGSITTNTTGKITDTVVVPPLAQPFKAVAENTATEIANILGADREELVFGDWAQGGIQIFAPGNLLLIGDQAQEFTIWVEPGSGGASPRFGCTYHVNGTIVASGPGDGLVPSAILQKFFSAWLNEYGVSIPAAQTSGN